MCNGSGFDRFSAATGVGYEDLATWEGFYDAAGAGSMTGRTSPSVRWIIPSAPWSSTPWSARGIFTRRGFLHGNGWYDTDNAVFKES